MNIEDYKNEEVENVILRITFQGAFQRAKVYSANALEQNRLKFRVFLAKKLKKILHKIHEIDNYDDNMHHSIIKDFAGLYCRDEN